MVKNLPASVGDTRDTDSIPGSGRYPRVGNGNPFQESCLENSIDRGTWWATAHGVAELDTTERLSSTYYKNRIFCTLATLSESFTFLLCLLDH